MLHGAPARQSRNRISEYLTLRPKCATFGYGGLTTKPRSVVPFTKENAAQYMIALGAKPTEAASLAGRVMVGEASFVTDLVQDGKIKRVTSNEAEDMPNVANLYEPQGQNGSVDELRRIISGLPPGDERRPLLEDLAARLEALSNM